MTRGAHKKAVWTAGPKFGLLALFILVVCGGRASAQEWQPTVVTSAGGDVQQRVAPVPLPRWADPRFMTPTRPKMVGRLPVAGQQAPTAQTAAPSPAAAPQFAPPLAAAAPGASSPPEVDPFAAPAPAEPTPLEARALRALDASSIETGSITAPKPIGLDAWVKTSSQALAGVQLVAGEAPAAAAPHGGSGEGHKPAQAEASKPPPPAGPAPVAAGAPAPAASAAAPAEKAITRPFDELPKTATGAQQYCFNTAEAVGDARVVWQAKRIKEMETELEKRVVELTAKTEEYKTWLQRRDDFARKAQDKLVAFYAKMKPDAAALQLSAMDEDMAAALLMKLEPKVASLVLAEIEPQRAAKITAIISGVAKKPPERRAKPANAAAGPGAGAGVGPAPAQGPTQPQAQAQPQPQPAGAAPSNGEPPARGQSKS